jgi:hypothetical protein
MKEFKKASKFDPEEESREAAKREKF